MLSLATEGESCEANRVDHVSARIRPLLFALGEGATYTCLGKRRRSTGRVWNPVLLLCAKTLSFFLAAGSGYRMAQNHSSEIARRICGYDLVARVGRGGM